MSDLKFQRITFDIYEDDFKVLQKRFGGIWPTFLRDIINQHTTPYGANRIEVLDDLTAEYDHSEARRMSPDAAVAPIVPEVWKRKTKGTGYIHTHPSAFEGRAIVENSYGISFNGAAYQTLDDAKIAALSVGATQSAEDQK